MSKSAFRLPNGWGSAASRLRKLYTEDGGPGSGNWGHKGRPGLVGGSGKGGGSHFRGGRGDIFYTSSKRDWLNGLKGERQQAATKFLNTWEPTEEDKAQGHKTRESVLIANAMPDDLQKFVDYLREARNLDDKKEAALWGQIEDDDEARAYTYLKFTYGMDPSKCTENGQEETARYMTNLMAKTMSAPHIENMEMPDELAYEIGIKERPKVKENPFKGCYFPDRTSANFAIESILGADPNRKSVDDMTADELERAEKQMFEKVASEEGFTNLGILHMYLRGKGDLSHIGDATMNWDDFVRAQTNADPYSTEQKPWPNLTDQETRTLRSYLASIKNYGGEGYFIRYRPEAMEYLALKNKVLGGEDFVEIAKQGDRDRPKFEEAKKRKAEEEKKKKLEEAEKRRAEIRKAYLKNKEANKVVIKGDAYSEKINSMRKADSDYSEQEYKDIGEETAKEVQKVLDEASKIDVNAQVEKLEKVAILLKEKRDKISKELDDIRQELYGMDRYDDPEKYDALKNRQRQTMDEYNKAINDVVHIRSQIRSARAAAEASTVDAVRKVLARVRKTGGISSADMKAHIPGRSTVKQFIADAYDRYPSEWFARSSQRGQLTARKVDRGYYSDPDGMIAISGWGDAGMLETAIHELGHRFEHTIPGIVEAEKAFYDRRTAGETSEQLRKITGSSGYKADEMTKKDNFLDPYIGKDYGRDIYEVVSMGFQYAFTNPKKLLQDRDYAQFILGLLTVA